MIIKVKAKSSSWDLRPDWVQRDEFKLCLGNFRFFSVLLNQSLCCFSPCVCQGWAVLLMDVLGCHLLIASVKMIDPSPQRGRLKFTATALNLHFAFPPVTYSADNDDTDCNPAALYSSLAEGLVHVQLAQWAEMSLLLFKISIFWCTHV